MSKIKSLIFKLVIFLFGLGIIGLSYYMFGPGAASGVTETGEAAAKVVSALDKFLWINITICYVAFFLPILLTSIRSNNVGNHVASLSVGWVALVIYEAVNITLTIVVFKEFLPIKAGILVEAITLFVLLIVMYLVFFANSYIADVEKHEQSVLSIITQVRSASQVLSLKASALGPEYTSEKNMIKGFEEELRFMIPVDSINAVSLETQIQVKLNEISSTIDSIQAGVDSGLLKTQVSAVEMLIKQRKLVTN